MDVKRHVAEDVAHSGLLTPKTIVELFKTVESGCEAMNHDFRHRCLPLFALKIPTHSTLSDEGKASHCVAA